MKKKLAYVKMVLGQLAPRKIQPPTLTLCLTQTLILISGGGGGAIFFKGNCLDTRKNIFKDTLKAFGHYGNKQKSMYILEVYLIHYTSGQNTYVKKMSFEQNK